MFEYETQTRNPLEAEEGAEVADGKGVQRHGEGKDAAKVRRVEVGDGGYTQWGERFPHIGSVASDLIFFILVFLSILLLI